MRAGAILTFKPFPPLEIERREALELGRSKLINDELRGIFRVAMSLTSSMPLLGDGWVALGLVQSRARSLAGYAEFPRSPFFLVCSFVNRSPR
jgi:hypothetical protein